MTNARRASSFSLHIFAFLLIVLLSACNSVPVVVPTPTAVPPFAITPTTTSILPTPAPQASPTSAGSVVTATAFTSATAKLLPVIVNQVDLGVSFDQPLQHRLALDLEGGHIFVGATPTQTLVLSTDDLSIVSTLPAGGDLAIDRLRARLYVGAPDGVMVYDLDSLQPLGSVPIVAKPFGSTPIVDESIGTIFIIRNGVYVVDPMTLDVTARISGTLPAPGGLVPNSFAVDATFDEERRLLYVSLNNGIPGSNGGNTLMIYNFRSTETIYRDEERSIVSLVADGNTGRAFITRSRFNSNSLSALSVDRNQVKSDWRVNGIVGSVKVDAQRGRVYVSDARGPSPRLLALDAATGTLIADLPLPRPYTLAAFDAESDLLYFLSSDGHLLVMNGHGSPAPGSSEQASEPAPAMTGTVAWIAPSPDLVNDPPTGMLFAAWLPEGYASGPLGSNAGQMMMSTDGGSTWARAAGGLPPHLFVNALAFSPDFARDKTVFAALLTPDGRGGGIYVSTDAGRSWPPSMSGLDDWVVADIAVAPGFVSNRTVFALTWQNGLYRSTDGGETWQRNTYRASTPIAMNARTLAFSPDYANDNTLAVSTGESVSISRDGGETWRTIVENRATSLVFSRDPTLLMGGFADAGVMRSEDAGETWQAASRGLRFDVTSRMTLALSPDFPRGQYALALVRFADQTALYRTVNSGASWEIETSGWSDKAQITAMTFAHDGSLFMGLDNGQLRMIKPTEFEWSNASVALDRLGVEAIALSPDFANDHTLFIGNGRAGVFVSSDGGRRWAETNLPARDSGNGKLWLALSPDFANDRVVFASAAGQVFRSDDGGANWRALTSGLGNFLPVSSLALSPQFADDRVMLVGGGFRAPRVMRSADGGETWTVASGLAQNGGVTALAFVPGNPRVVYAWADLAGLYRSGDGGASWTRVFSPTATISFGLQALAISPDFERDRLMFAGAFGEQNILRSADGGAAWHPSDSGLPAGLNWGSALAVSPDFARDRTLFLGTDKGVFRSEDGGVTWRASSAGLPQAAVLSLAISPDFGSDRTIFAGLVERGLYVSTDGGATWKPAR